MIYCLGFKVPSLESTLGKWLDIHLLFDIDHLICYTFGMVDIPTRKSHLGGFCIVPLLIPPTVVGLGLLYVFGQQGLLGGVLMTFNIQIAFQPTAVILAQIVVASPLYIRTMIHTFREIPQQTMVVGATLGLSQLKCFDY